MGSSSAVYHVQPVDHPLDAVIRVPGSKSIANRALICATLAEGVSTLRNVPSGDDTSAMLDCVALLGAGVGADIHDSTMVRLHGTGGALRDGPLSLSAQLAGTTSRFITALCALGHGHYEIDGLPPLRSRPMGPLHDALATLGVAVQPGEQWGHLPVTIQGLRSGTGPVVNSVAMPGDISSQYITALMLIAPYLPAGLNIQLTTPLVSRPYVAITAAVMRAFGASDVTVGERSVNVAPGRYSACDYSIEPDASSASYAFAAAAICGGQVRVPDLGADALQGDAAFAAVLASMGCIVDHSSSGTSVRRDGDLHGISINMADLSDLVPTLAVIAPFASSPTEITGVGFIRAKESDRLGDLAAELRKCGIDATEQTDGIVVRPGYSGGAALDTHHDHRLAMAFAVLGLRIAGVRVHDPDVVSKSWPDFWMALEAVRGAA
jgi:3-phosphoshikimate 1-carboxyvinyltransferase